MSSGPNRVMTWRLLYCDQFSTGRRGHHVAVSSLPYKPASRSSNALASRSDLVHRASTMTIRDGLPSWEPLDGLVPFVQMNPGIVESRGTAWAIDGVRIAEYRVSLENLYIAQTLKTIAVTTVHGYPARIDPGAPRYRRRRLQQPVLLTC
jgi:hypothetical protein